ncbi:hypothetical protein [Terasakiella pusilla]|uniref:hypothetical protein n=1 Tax=Terasakiella pusilla TaxID=64973 RepID=UPI00146F9758|nr:hypothetical protein [Terasakiella pusilla]
MDLNKPEKLTFRVDHFLGATPQTYCTFFDYIIHTETYRKRYQSRYKNNFLPHCLEDGALMPNVFVSGFDAIYRSLHEMDGILIPAFKRQYDKIEPEKRPFVFYMLHKYMNNIFSNMESRLQYCLLAVCNGIEDGADFPENFSVDINTGVLHPHEDEGEFTMKRNDLPLDVPAFDTW